VSPNPSHHLRIRRSQHSRIRGQFPQFIIGGSSYKWLFGDGNTLTTIKQDTTVSHLYNASGTFTTCLAVYNTYGCIDTSCQQISVIINSCLMCPMHSPNGDGVNDKIYVRGFGIAKMNWTIYNRWGKVVYQGR
jgi:hypothetical protein